VLLPSILKKKTNDLILLFFKDFLPIKNLASGNKILLICISFYDKIKRIFLYKQYYRKAGTVELWNQN